MSILRSANITGSPLLLGTQDIKLPVIGYKSQTSSLSVTSPSTNSPFTDTGEGETTDFPLNNLLNPATHLRWESGDTSSDIEILASVGSTVNYVAFAVHELSGFTVTIYGATTNSPSDFLEIFEAHTLTDNLPLIIEFPSGSYEQIKIKIAGSGVRRAAVMYVGALIRMERGVKVDVDHTPISRGVKTDVLSGYSESGNFMGRLVRNVTRESTIEFSHITRDWYVTNSSFDTWLQSYISTYPFFIAWAPYDYPNDVGFCWALNDPTPMQNPVTRRFAVNIQMRGFG